MKNRTRMQWLMAGLSLLLIMSCGKSRQASSSLINQRNLPSQEGITGSQGNSITNLDAAPFARIATWDPNRSKGAKAGHIEEFLEEDLFLSAPLIPDKKGAFQPPVLKDGQSCIGLEWDARRNLKEITIRFADNSPMPTPEKSGVGCWQGASAWQGGWTGLAGEMKAEGRLWRFTLQNPQAATQKIRWRFFDAKDGLAIGELQAITLSTMTQCQVAVCPAREKAAPGKIKIANCWIAEKDGWLTSKNWDGRSTQVLTIHCTTPSTASHSISDRTILQFQMPDHQFAIALDDVIKRGPVYVADAGVYVAKAPLAESPKEYQQRLADHKTILEEVRSMPEQTREQAMAKTHNNPFFDQGRMMISLACDNDKFVVDRNGTVRFYKNFLQGGGWTGIPPDYSVEPRYGYNPILSATQEWGSLGIDKSAGSGKIGAPFRIKDKPYERGLGHHANGEITIDLKGKFKRFEAEAGVQWQGGKNKSSVIFQVLVDDKIQFDSGIMRDTDPAKPISIPLSGAAILTLKATDAGDGIPNDVANWAEARLISKADSQPHYLGDFLRKGSVKSRHLADGWRPAPIATMEADGLRYTQKTYVVPYAPENTASAPLWLNSQPLGVMEITIENPLDQPAEASVALAFRPDKEGTNKPEIRKQANRAIFESNGRILMIMDHGAIPSASIRIKDALCQISARIAAKDAKTIYAFLPIWDAPTKDSDKIAGGDKLFPQFAAYWDQIMEPAMQIDLPDKWLTDVIRANQAHIFLAARNSEGGARFHPWIASESYPQAIDSEGNSPLRAMIDFGHYEFARRAFDFYFAQYKPEGFMTTGYTLLGNGWHLWTLAEYLELSQDKAWFQQREAKPINLCDWVMRQRAKTRKMLPNGEKVPEFGLMPPGTQADWAAFAYYFNLNAHFQRGLEQMGRVLSQWNYEQGNRILANAEDYRKNILQAYRRTQSLSPVVPLRNGRWAEFSPCAVHTAGPIGDFFPGEDGKRSWAYDVELGAHHLAALGVMPPNDPHVDDMMDYMEDYYFLHDGWGAYPAEMNQADWFNMGGFAKMQPYYARNAEIYAERDDVKPFLRRYFNAMASLIDGEVLSFYEHLTANCVNKTHETGYFLRQSRLMLLMERGDDLWLIPFAPRAWLQDGKTITVKNAPSIFGPVSYRIDSAVARNQIMVTIEPPKRSQPKEIVLRLRHPEEKRIRAIEAAKGVIAEIGQDGETIHIKPSGAAIAFNVNY